MAESSEHSTEEEDEEDIEQGQVVGLQLPVPRRKPQGYNSKKPNFRQTIDLCFCLLHEAVVKSQWEKAAELMLSYLQTLEDTNTERQRRAPEIIWRFGSEILLNHPKSTVEDVRLFQEQIKNVGIKSYLQISLEHIFFLLCNGGKDEAHLALTSAESWKCGRYSLCQENTIKLIQAYKGVLDYQSWLQKKAAISQGDMSYATQLNAVKEMCIFHQQAKAALRGILKFPGVWDPFVLCYIDLLESSEDKAEMEQILRDYAYNPAFPANPNAYVYLYEFLKRNEASSEALINVLKDLYSRVPSHKLMLEFCTLLKQSESNDHHQLALQVLFSLLDFSGWRKSVEAWGKIGKQLKKSIKSHKSWIEDQWRSRRDWWPVYHFTKFHAEKEWKERPKLAMKKALTAGILLGPGCEYYEVVCGLGRKNKMIKVRAMKKFLKNHSCSFLE
ncbi:TATA box-binding protein-associated factor RNA polymerase I subunit A [Xenopus laevis]|uniref:TATA box-binding protein-associated factor RNA polymerase I subunit A n=2 Tax=Xenopus laevis TaxID=8355 RepID=A0A1L8G6H0_XENLA|nr:TATA box-binding protein-associated factor RNA polymerase I subunit A [Xenopus laevis]OCT79442.1 hypothetical protein XELAEV_18026251mg [Xenopus laevis]